MDDSLNNVSDESASSPCNGRPCSAKAISQARWVDFASPARRRGERLDGLLALPPLRASGDMRCFVPADAGLLRTLAEGSSRGEQRWWLCLGETDRSDEGRSDVDDDRRASPSAADPSGSLGIAGLPWPRRRPHTVLSGGKRKPMGRTSERAFRSRSQGNHRTGSRRRAARL